MWGISLWQFKLRKDDRCDVRGRENYRGQKYTFKALHFSRPQDQVCTPSHSGVIFLWNLSSSSYFFSLPLPLSKCEVFINPQQPGSCQQLVITPCYHPPSECLEGSPSFKSLSHCISSPNKKTTSFTSAAETPSSSHLQSQSTLQAPKAPDMQQWALETPSPAAAAKWASIYPDNHHWNGRK